ncbi:hypothetical protein [Methanobrevibacter sp.]
MNVYFEMSIYLFCWLSLIILFNFFMLLINEGVITYHTILDEFSLF